MGLPGAFDAAGGGVGALAAAVPVDPAEAHRLERCGFGLGPDELGIARAVGLAEGVPAGHQGHRLLVVHGHAREGLAHVTPAGHRVGPAVGAFGVHVDQAHLHGSQRVLEVALAAVAAAWLVARGEPLLLGAPVDVFLGCPDVLAAAAEAEGLEAHGLHGHVAGQDHQIGPGDGVAVLLLDRPQQATRLVEVAVVGPAVDGREALVARARPAAAVGRAVSASAVPGHADEQAAIVAPVGRPPVLRLRHQGGQILLQRMVIELAEGLRVVEACIHRTRHRLVLVQDGQVQLTGPPVGVGLRALRAAGTTMERTLHLAHHMLQGFKTTRLIAYNLYKLISNIH